MKYGVVLCVFFSVLFTQQAPALSCMPVEMTAEEIEQTDAIFIGEFVDPDVDKNGRKRRRKSRKKKITATKSEKEAGPNKPFELKVVRAWKGAQEDESITVMRDTTWGDGYQPGEQYLIGAKKQKDGKLVVPLCGLSFHYPSYEQRKKHYNFFGDEQLEAIKVHFLTQQEQEE